jgi:hypothetical protein
MKKPSIFIGLLFTASVALCQAPRDTIMYESPSKYGSIDWSIPQTVKDILPSEVNENDITSSINGVRSFMWGRVQITVSSDSVSFSNSRSYKTIYRECYSTIQDPMQEVVVYEIAERKHATILICMTKNREKLYIYRMIVKLP